MASSKLLANGGGKEEIMELLSLLKEHSRCWFVGFVEKFLGSNANSAQPLTNVDAMLEALERILGWLDEVDREQRVRRVNVGDLTSKEIRQLRTKIQSYNVSHKKSTNMLVSPRVSQRQNLKACG